MTEQLGFLQSKFESTPYQFIKKIGEGGFGQVYEARNQITDQTVAIKILTLSAEFSSEKTLRYIERFERETLLVGKLNHPNIVRLLDKGKIDTTIYAVFEFVEGESLKDRLLREGPMAPTEAAQIMAQVLDALSHAHNQGVIHRDIKPANIMLTQTGMKTLAKILDFGIGTIANEARKLDYKSLTLTQETLGTPAYSAPEQLRGEMPTQKTDLYVWALVFIECLTGAPAVQGSSLAAIFHRQLSPENIPLPSSIAGHPVTALLRRALNKKVNERASYAEDLYKELIQLNFSSLVGDLNLKPYEGGAPNLTETFGETIVNDSGFTQSSLTERKQISVLSINLDIVKLTHDEVDIELIDTLYRDQLTQITDKVMHFGAFHVGTLANTLLFYFGYPKTSDNDSRLAARAVLEISSSIKHRNALIRFNHPVEFQFRAGMHSGVFTIAADTVPDGETAKVAMNLSRMAEPNQILCSEPTHLGLATFVHFEKGNKKVSSLEGDLLCYRLTGERQAEALGFLRASNRLHEFVGREHELNIVLSQFNDGEKKSNKHISYIYGEAGIGKSRLIIEARNQLSNRAQMVAQCLPENINNALYPILTLIKNIYNLENLPNSKAVDLLTETLSRYGNIDIHNGIPILCSWLGLSLPEKQQSFSLQPDQQRDLLLELASDLIFSEKDQSSLLFIEDIHWADPTTLDFISRISSKCSPVRGLIVTSRSPLPPSIEKDLVETIHVEKLSEKHTEKLIDLLFEQNKVSQRLIDLIISRTDGIPLFIEELVNMLKQKKLVHYLNGINDFKDENAIKSVPQTLRDSLQQKLDSLRHAKETAQLASAIGRIFSYDLIKTSSGVEEEQLQANLKELVSAELIYLQRKVDGNSYIFKHALVRDAAYDSLTETNRKGIHLALAKALEDNFKQIAVDQPYEIARHYSKAEEFSKATHFELLSANKSLNLTSSTDAIEHCEKIFSWSNHLPLAKKEETKLNASIIMTLALMNKDGWAGEQVSVYAVQCLKLMNNIYFNSNHDSIDLNSSSQLNDDVIAQLVQIYYAIILHNIVSGNRGTLKNLENISLDEIVGDLESLISLTSNSGLHSAADAILGYFYYTKGDFIKGAEILERSINTYNAETDKNHGMLYGFDSKVWSAATLGLLYWLKDEIEKSNYFMTLSISYGEQSNHMPSLCIALMYKCIQRQYEGDSFGVLKTSEELIEKATEYNLPAHLTYGQVINYWAINANNTLSKEQKLDLLTKAEAPVNGLKNLGCFHAVAYFESLLADIELALELPQAANKRLESCIELCASIGEHYYHPVLPYRKALVEEQLGNNEERDRLLSNAENWAKSTSMTKVIKLVNEARNISLTV